MRLLLLLLFASVARATPVTALAFSPDGAVLAVASGRNVTLRSSPEGRETGSFSCDGERALALAFQSDGPLLAVGTGTPGEKGGVRLLDWRRQRWLSSTAANSDAVTSVAFSPDGKSLAVASADNSGAVYRIEADGTRLAPAFKLTGHSAAVQAVTFSPDGQTIVTASADRSVKVWSAEDGRLIRSLGQHTDAVHTLAFRPVTSNQPEAPPSCASGGDECAIRVWQPTIGRMVRIVRHHDGPVLALRFTPDGRTLFSAGKEGLIRRIDADSDEVLGTWRAASDWIYSLAISPDGKVLASGDWSGAVHRWSIGDREIKPLAEP